MPDLLTVLPAKRALREQIAERSSLSDPKKTLVRIGLLSDLPPQLERVYIVGTRDLTRELVVEQGGFEETYALVVVVEVRQLGRDEPTRENTEARAWDIVEEIGIAIATDNELGGLVDEAWIAQVPTEDTVPTQDGWICKITIRVSVKVLSES